MRAHRWMAVPALALGALAWLGPWQQPWVSALGIDLALGARGLPLLLAALMLVTGQGPWRQRAVPTSIAVLAPCLQDPVLMMLAAALAVGLASPPRATWSALAAGALLGVDMLGLGSVAGPHGTLASYLATAPAAILPGGVQALGLTVMLGVGGSWLGLVPFQRRQVTAPAPLAAWRPLFGAWIMMLGLALWPGAAASLAAALMLWAALSLGYAAYAMGTSEDAPDRWGHGRIVLASLVALALALRHPAGWFLAVALWGALAVAGLGPMSRRLSWGLLLGWLLLLGLTGGALYRESQSMLAQVEPVR